MKRTSRRLKWSLTRKWIARTGRQRRVGVTDVVRRQLARVVVLEDRLPQAADPELADHRGARCLGPLEGISVVPAVDRTPTGERHGYITLKSGDSPAHVVAAQTRAMAPRRPGDGSTCRDDRRGRADRLGHGRVVPGRRDLVGWARAFRVVVRVEISAPWQAVPVAGWRWTAVALTARPVLLGHGRAGVVRQGVDGMDRMTAWTLHAGDPVQTWKTLRIATGNVGRAPRMREMMQIASRQVRRAKRRAASDLVEDERECDVVPMGSGLPRSTNPLRRDVVRETRTTEIIASIPNV